MARAMKGNGARLTAFARGQTVGLDRTGLSPKDIVKFVRKKDKTKPSLEGVYATLRKAQALPDWDGEDSARPGAGRPPTIAEKLAADIVKMVFAERGSKVVTVKYIKKRLVAAKRYSPHAVTHALSACQPSNSLPIVTQ